VSSPRELERDFATAILGGPDEAIAGQIQGDGLEPAARIAVYRHHVFVTLTEALEATYPVVVRLVDRRFFAYAADWHIRRNPPVGPCLFEYGESFADFLAAFPPCRDLAYLADVARLEWAMNRALHAEDAVTLDPRWLSAVPPGELARLKLRLHPSLSLLESPWPIDQIWRANQPGADPEATVSLDAGAVRLEICRLEDRVVFRSMTTGTYAFERAFATGLDLQSAMEAARSADPSFDLTHALRELMDRGVIVGASAPSIDNGGPRCKPTPRPC